MSDRSDALKSGGREMWPVSLKTEVQEDGKWVEKTDRELT
ncbi:RF-1 domain peptide chain release factor [Mycobacterium phage I3]|uniref:Uncharacterized protein n=1 Tax=Mycobacterium phage I3 TaxID=2994057 RepID=A0A8F2E7T8_9CAUD|nr:RF-1 domain peptide chain release factor [Mycobacterium phage I3]QWT30463.1 hypothetical protein PBI_I3_220 [Mycobacterium phage I3]